MPRRTLGEFGPNPARAVPLGAEFSFDEVARQMLQDIRWLATVVVAVGDVDGTHGFRRLDGCLVQLPVPQADPHESDVHGFPDPHVLVIVDRALDAIDALQKEVISGRLLPLEFRPFIQEPPRAAATNCILTVHPFAREVQRERGLG